MNDAWRNGNGNLMNQRESRRYFKYLIQQSKFTCIQPCPSLNYTENRFTWMEMYWSKWVVTENTKER